MTASESASFFLKADIVLKHMADLTTKTVTLYNRIWTTETPSGFPLIKTVDGLGAEMDLYLPAEISGSLVIEDSWNTYGYERRFSDLLDTYAIHDQPITISVSADGLDAGVGASFSTVHKAYCNSWARRISPDGAELQIFFSAKPFKKTYFPQVVLTTTPQMSGAPEEVRGLPIPMVFGSSVEVIPIKLNQVTDPIYGYQTQFHTKFVGGGITGMYVQGNIGFGAGLWRSLTNCNSSNVAQNIFGTASAGGSVKSKERASPFTLSNYYVISGGAIKCRGVTGGNAISGLTFEIKVYYQANTAIPPLSVIATAVIHKNVYNTAMGVNGVDFDALFTFDRPFVADRPLYMSFKETYTDVASGLDALPIRTDAAPTSNSWERTEADANNTIGWRSQSFFPPVVELHGLYWEDLSVAGSDVDELGFICRRVRLNQKTAASDQTKTNFADLNYVVVCDGIKDDSGGSITGAASTLLEKPTDIAQLFKYEWDGSNWTASSRWGTNPLLPSTPSPCTGTYERKLAGQINEYKIVTEVLTDICRNGGVRIGVLNDGGLTVWAWGDNSEVTDTTDQYTLTQEVCQVTDVFANDLTYVINKITAKYYATGRSNFNYLLNPNPGASVAPYSAISRRYNGASALDTALTGNSQTLFGPRVLEEDEFPLIQASNTMQVMGNHFLTVYNKPAWYATVICPYVAFKDLRLLDVVRISHPDIPVFEGGSPNSLSPNINGQPVDVSLGFVHTKTQTHRAIIEARRIVYDDDKGLSLEFRLRLLLNYPADPT